MFGIRVTEKVSNQYIRCYSFPTHLTSASALPEISIISLKMLYHCIASFKQMLFDSSNLLTCKSCSCYCMTLKINR